MSDVGGGVPPVKLLKKLHAIMTAVEGIKKSGYNKNHKYYYALEKDVLEAVRAQLIEKQLFIVPRTKSATIYPMGDKALTDLEMGFTIYDLESGESIESDWRGQGVDYGGDKGLYKAFTGGNKYFSLMLFQIPRDDDPEADRFTDSPPDSPKATVKAPQPTNKLKPYPSEGGTPKWPTKEQKEELKALIKERDVPEQALKNIKAQMGYGGGAEYLTAQAFILQLKKMPFKNPADDVPFNEKGEIENAE